MVSWRRAFLTALKIVAYEFLIGIAIIILYFFFGAIIVSLLVSPSSMKNVGSILTSGIAFLVGFFCLAMLGFAVPIKILTELVAEETNKGRIGIYSWICPNCNLVNPAESRFCSHCGKPFIPISKNVKEQASNELIQASLPRKENTNNEPKQVKSSIQKPATFEIDKKNNEAEPVKTLAREPKIAIAETESRKTVEIKQPINKKEFHKINKNIFYFVGGLLVIVLGYILNTYIRLQNIYFLSYSFFLIGLLLIFYSLYFIYQNNK